MIAVGIVLHATDFFQIKKGWSSLVFDWKYWLNYDNNIFSFKYYGICCVCAVVFLVIFPLLFFLVKLCCDVMRIEREIQDVRRRLQKLEQERVTTIQSLMQTVAKFGVVNISIGSCFNIKCTCYITLIASFTTLASMTVIGFCCYVMYTFIYYSYH